MKLSPKTKPTPTDPRLDVPPTTAAQVELAIEVSQAPTSAAAFDLLGDLGAQQARRVLLQAALDADAATTKGHTAVKALVATGAAVPTAWTDRLADLEVARLEAVWAVGDHDAEHQPPDADWNPSDPSALAVRLITPATRRLGELDPPPGAWLDAARREIDRHAPSWDVENTKAACRALVRGAVEARYGGGA